MFKDFIKKFGIMLLFVAMVITCVGAISTSDAAFVSAGIVSAITLAVAAYKGIKNNSGNLNRE